MASAYQIREQVASFLLNEQSLGSLMDWLTRSVWTADPRALEARQLAGDIELIVAEYSAHHIDQGELSRQLFNLLSTLTIGGPATSTTSTTSSRTSLIFVGMSRPHRPSVPIL